MEKQVIEIRIKKDGTTSLEAKEGIVGQNCREKTRQLEIMLGGEVADTQNTKAYYEDDGDNLNSLNLNI